MRCKFIAAFNSSGRGYCHANTFKWPRLKDREKKAHLGKIKKRTATTSHSQTKITERLHKLAFNFASLNIAHMKWFRGDGLEVKVYTFFSFLIKGAKKYSQGWINNIMDAVTAFLGLTGNKFDDLRNKQSPSPGEKACGYVWEFF